MPGLACTRMRPLLRRRLPQSKLPRKEMTENATSYQEERESITLGLRIQLPNFIVLNLLQNVTSLNGDMHKTHLTVIYYSVQLDDEILENGKSRKKAAHHFNPFPRLQP